jgi:choline dehydrogenase-like flavoprotein
MRWLSEHVEALIALDTDTVHDAVVVGSGYGGAVSALRLAEIGVGVLVLERGNEYLPGDFPNDFGEVPGHVRIQRNGAGNLSGSANLTTQSATNINGYESGLYDFRFGDDVGALVGNALGGTSQINANVVLRPDLRVFSKLAGGPGSPMAWPAAIQLDDSGRLPNSLEEGYELATTMLSPERVEPTTFDSSAQPALPLKTQRLAELAGLIEQDSKTKQSPEHTPGTASPRPVTVAFKLADITVCLKKPCEATDGTEATEAAPSWPVLDKCNACGDCVTGCNYNAKKTLTTNYLPRAREAGARMFTGVSVLTVHKERDVWVVRFVRTESRKMQRDGVDVPVHELRARHVVLSAGTFGSTEILLRSRNEYKLALSAQLGRHLSTNGDSLAFGYQLSKPVNGIGVGSGNAANGVAGIGPTITGIIHIDDAEDVTQSVLIEEGAIPGAIAGVFHEMISTSAALAQLDAHKFRDESDADTPPADAKDWSVLAPQPLSHTQTLLCMGHDPCSGTMEMDAGTDGLKLFYPKEDASSVQALEALQDRYLTQVAQQGAIPVSNPVIRPLPPSVTDVLSGPRMANGSFTVHPLGGCAMADSPLHGVVNSLGQVFDTRSYDTHTDSTGLPTLYHGLVVLDGAIVPTALGANPMLTITALAERAMKTLAPLVKADAAAGRTRPGPLVEPPALAKPPVNPYATEVGVYFTEAMRAPRSDGQWQFKWRGLPRPAHLVLHLPIVDLKEFSGDKKHVIAFAGDGLAQPVDRERLPARLRIDADPFDDSSKVELMVTSGEVRILPVPQAGGLTRLSLLVRTGFTWWIVRGFDEVVRYFGQWLGVIPPDPGGSSRSDFKARYDWFKKLCNHASESRNMHYVLQLEEQASLPDALPRPAAAYTLKGTKYVGYSATWSALFGYVAGRIADLFTGLLPRKRTALRTAQPKALPTSLRRANVWTAFGELHTTIEDATGRVAGKGILQLDMLDMTKMHAPQLGLQRDTPNALLGLAAYPLWFARLIVKTRLWDFRLPDYPRYMPTELAGNDHTPVPPASVEPPTLWPKFPPLRIYFPAQGSANDYDSKPVLVPPCESVELEVRRSADNPACITLKLTRYRHTHLQSAATKGGLRQFKTLLMLNGFAQSTLGFVPQEHIRKPGQPDDEPGLAEFFYEQGFDVWLFDYRTSSILDASKLPCSMDDIAAYDIPAAVDHVLQSLSLESAIPAAQIQIYAFAHCVGAASLAMSLLGGHLKHAAAAGQSANDKLAGVTLTQMQAFLVGGKTSQMRLQVGGVLRDALGIEYLRLSGAEREPTALESVLDRLFASLPVDTGEECPNEHNRILQRPGICTCKRMSGTISRLLKHDRIKEETHDRLPVYFGRANTSLLVHGGRCVENERLVNADGQNVYVTDANIKAHLRMPVAVLHGKHNALFDVESAVRTHQQLQRVNHDLNDIYVKIIAEDYAHFDCTIGYGLDMQDQILKPLVDFYTMAWRFNELEASQGVPNKDQDEMKDWARRSFGKPALAGPLVGWSRTSVRDGRTYRKLRFWIEVDETEAARCDGVIIDCLEAGRAQCVPALRVPLSSVPGRPDVALLRNIPIGDHEAWIAIGVADLEFDITNGWDKDLTVRMYGLHHLWEKPGDAPPASAPPQPDEPVQGTADLPRPQIVRQPAPGIARPLTPQEIEDDLAKGSFPLSYFEVGELNTKIFLGAPKFNLNLNLSMTTQQPGRLLEEMATGAFLAEELQAIREQTVNTGPISDAYADQLWETLLSVIERNRDTAMRADPGTLSRKFRQLALPRANDPGVVRLSAQTIRGAGTQDAIRFIAACCRHPGLAFEDGRSDASLRQIKSLVDESSKGAGSKGDRDNGDSGIGKASKLRPALAVMLGDQIYADATAGVMDSPSAIEKIALRHRKAFATAGFAELTASLPTYMVMDDHEISDNWSRDLMQPAPGKGADAHRAQAERTFFTARASFAAYQYAHGPRNSNAPGFNCHFQEGAYPFFVLDTRSFRQRFGLAPQLCVPAQMNELTAWLCAQPDDARPKFVLSGSVLAPGMQQSDTDVPGVPDRMAESWQLDLRLRNSLLDFIACEKIRNVVFVSGDYHCSAQAQMQVGTVQAYAVVTPPLYAPLPFANSKPADLLAQEKFVLPSGAPVSITAQFGSGNGFSDIEAKAMPGGSWELKITQHQLDTAAPASTWAASSTTYTLR